MSQKSGTPKLSSKQVVKDIRRTTRRQYSAEEKIRIVLDGLRGETDIRTVHWHGNTALRRGSRIDMVELFPATTEVVDMRPDSVGT